MVHHPKFPNNISILKTKYSHFGNNGGKVFLKRKLYFYSLNPPKMKFQLTAVFIEDEKSKGYTAFFAEFPNIISEGKDLQQARELLEECFLLAIKDISKRELEKVKSHSPTVISQEINLTTQDSPFKSAHCCPVCAGNGKVPNGFYLITRGSSIMTTDATPEQCQSCKGTGIVWG